VCKLFEFSTSSPEPLGQFEPHLAQIILGEGIPIGSNEGDALLQGEIITKQEKIY
jgi:hypothetical protein